MIYFLARIICDASTFFAWKYESHKYDDDNHFRGIVNFFSI